MLYVDLDRFWENDMEAHKNNCFNPLSPQVALGIEMGDECVFSELNVKGDPFNEIPRETRLWLNKMYNDKAEKIVGRRLLSENIPAADMCFPKIKRIGEVFGGVYETRENTGEWLFGTISGTKELERLLDKIDSLDIRGFMLPQNWESEKKRIYESYGLRPSPLRHIRGPVTLATSVLGIEPLIFLFYDARELFLRFSKTIASVIIKMSLIMDEEAGFENNSAPAGFSFADDNCCLLTYEMYQSFGLPVLNEVFNTFSPDEGDFRYQHSDSDMRHLLPLLSGVNLTACNFGPTVSVEDIRKHMPNTRIDGCIAPYTFMSNDTDAIISEAKRDCLQIKNTAAKGLNLTTAGGINNGSLLESMRAVMYAIQNFGRY